MGKPVYELICENMTEKGFLKEDFALPPEEDSPVKWAPGAQDGVVMFHMGPEGIDASGGKLLARALKQASEDNYTGAEELFAQWTKEHRVIGVVDGIQQYVLEHKDVLNAGNLFYTAASMVVLSEHMECVKAGLVLLELFEVDEEDLRTVIRRLALCDEFTIFALWNMRKWEDGNQEIFDTARKVHGWGRIHAVDMLRPETDEIRKWLLEEGCINSVSNSYSALTCWNKSGAEEILFASPTHEEYKGLAVLIEALLDEGPAAGISGLEYPEDILERFLALSEQYDPDPDDYEVILVIRNWAEDQEETFEKAKAEADRILHSPRCRMSIMESVQRGKGFALARELGIACQDHLMKYLREDFDRYCGEGQYLIRDPEYSDEALEIYAQHLLENREDGKEYLREARLSLVLQNLGQMPLKGIGFVKAGFQSTAQFNRNFALAVLQEWVRETGEPLKELSADLYETLKNLENDEAEEGNAEVIRLLLAGEIESGEEEDNEHLHRLS